MQLYKQTCNICNNIIELSEKDIKLSTFKDDIIVIYKCSCCDKWNVKLNSQFFKDIGSLNLYTDENGKLWSMICDLYEMKSKSLNRFKWFLSDDIPISFDCQNYVTILMINILNPELYGLILENINKFPYNHSDKCEVENIVRSLLSYTSEEKVNKEIDQLVDLIRKLKIFIRDLEHSSRRLWGTFA